MLFWLSNKKTLFILQNNIFCFSRHYGIKSPFFDTVFLPVTNFPPKGTVKIEKEIENLDEFKNLYRWQKEHFKNNEKFILHDGPPYANGDVHVGHAVNKILKDITNRYKLLRGFQIDYTPGWDCHGLPIEIKAIKGGKKKYKSLPPEKIRDLSKKFAESTIEKQKNVFKRWGVMADWDNGCYYTFNNNYIAKELKAFYDIYSKGYIYRDLMPVYWSPSSETALAESELEYVENHQSKSAYVSFKLATIPEVVRSNVNNNNVSIIVWTTQPWTLASNQAVCYSNDVIYCLVKMNSMRYIICETQLPNLSTFFNQQIEIIKSFNGNCLQNCTYEDPLNEVDIKCLYHSNHVTVDKGTGFVHIAPAHGHEDFRIAQEYNLDTSCGIDAGGCFTDSNGDFLTGKFIFTDGNDAIIEVLKQRNSLIKEHMYTHSYPFDWRTKQPIFIKVSKQWFVDNKTLKKEIPRAFESVKLIPESSKNNLLNAIDKRTYWCISRQRVWGVPIPVFYHKTSDEFVLNRHSIEHLIEVVKEHGADAWWNLPVDRLLSQSILDKSGYSMLTSDDFIKGNDILDIWFDSGISWLSVLGENDSCNEVPVADLYLEGVDQCGGWFLSSLLTSLALNKRAPYKAILTHHFAVAEKTRLKMSKSLGNVVDPVVITDGGKNLDKHPAFGVNVLRWWVASSNVYTDIAAGNEVFSNADENVKKIRMKIRFMIGSLSNFNENDLVSYDKLTAIDKYYLGLLNDYVNSVGSSYEGYNFSTVTKSTVSFLTDLSNVYFTIIKSRLYCGTTNERHCCQTVLFHLLNNITTLLSPILPHLSAEVGRHHPLRNSHTAVFEGGWFTPQSNWANLDLQNYMSQILTLRNCFQGLLNGKRPEEFDSVIYHSHEFDLDLTKLQKELKSSSSELCEVFCCSHTIVNLVDNLDGINCDDESIYLDPQKTFAIQIKHSDLKKCPRCRRFASIKAINPCDKCCDIIGQAWAE